MDPYCIRRGFLFSHFGSHFVSEHPKIKELYKQVDMSDLEGDLLVMFQKRFRWILIPIFCFLLPVNAPVEYWNESILVSVFVIGFLRHALVTNISWLVNSSSCIWGLRLGDRYLPLLNSLFYEESWSVIIGNRKPLCCRYPSGEDDLVFIVSKTFWPAYHYLVPNDYRSEEFGGYGSGLTTFFIQAHLSLGTAWEAKTTNSTMIKDAIKQAVKRKRLLRDCIAGKIEKSHEFHVK
ncbi:hypothetical protein J437_LFUL016085 [Ladona fulva]|uniref:Uncharacterized protein n=1 Tax=Ladona fulva TaxID=123851 RepID=A0A8K0PB60_LADFU|nr:hypothetical protein J437_LFUL016085 [Ladona fulva]